MDSGFRILLLARVELASRVRNKAADIRASNKIITIVRFTLNFEVKFLDARLLLGVPTK